MSPGSPTDSPAPSCSTARHPSFPELLTFLTPVTDEKAEPKEDHPEHAAPDATQHLALGRLRLYPWGAEPSVSFCPHRAQQP